jgi:hypothetical protein
LRVALEAGWDAGMYLVGDCGDILGSCQAAADAYFGGLTERLRFLLPQAGVYYLIVDSDGDCGPATLFTDPFVPATRRSWGAVKGLYR